MDRIKLRAYQGLLKSGRITKETVYNNVLSNKITPEDYKQITNEECPELPLDRVKENKINEIKLECQNKIYSGFYSTVKYDEPKLYTLKDYEQSNLQALLIGIMGGATSVPWRHSELVVCDIWTSQEFMELYNQASAFTINQRYKSDVVELYILQEELTVEDVNNCNLDMKLPQSYIDILTEKLNQAGVSLWTD